MNHMQQILQTHPRQDGADAAFLAEAAQALGECALACVACADACLGEEQVAGLRRCVRACLDCADICAITGRLVARRTEPNPALCRGQIETCLAACHACAAECHKHASMHEHCRACGEACRHCEGLCRQLVEQAAAA